MKGLLSCCEPEIMAVFSDLLEAIFVLWRDAERRDNKIGV
jgi:hypothetical protein